MAAGPDAAYQLRIEFDHAYIGSNEDASAISSSSSATALMEATSLIAYNIIIDYSDNRSYLTTARLGAS